MLVSVCNQAFASAPPTPVTLTKKLADELGFRIETIPDGQHLVVTMQFPQRIGELWKAVLVGFALLDSNGEEIAITTMHYSPDSDDPRVVAAFDPIYGSSSIWVAYACDSEVESDCYGKHTVAYRLESVTEYGSSL